MTLFKQKIAGHFKSRKLNIFVLFIALALLFSVLSKLSNKNTHIFVFKINALNVPEEYVIINDSSNTLRITLTTYGFKLVKYYFKEPTIDIDFKNLDKNSTHFNWIERRELSNIVNQFDANVIVENIDPDTLTFRYDVNAVKMIPLVLKSEINYASGFDLTENLKLQPDSVKVIGPKILIDTITQINTKKMVLDNVNSAISQGVQLKLPSGNQSVKFSHEKTIISGDVERFTEGTISVPVNVINIPNNVKINYYPKTVSVIYYTSLSNFKSISSSSFIVECDYNLINDQDNYLIPKIVQQPSLVKNAKLNSEQIEFIEVQ